MSKSSRVTGPGRTLDWAGLVPSGLLLATGIRDYRDGGSVGWPIGGALLVLISLWVVYRGRARRARDSATPR
ncbi:hypothetical protein LUW75_05085 [Streptomyces sp. MRC013]|uniref:hypothetical protein n=1 Tax=Streptomyces sp. MRC013 TaxID=2898276 RepID=UPI002026F38C|nr:hypothetical protein [Streptomyces sp. MRC013]URM89474.1 hypothetical protein LUW75_05085 [Streptomyces sp. MRC013]